MSRWSRLSSSTTRDPWATSSPGSLPMRRATAGLAAEFVIAGLGKEAVSLAFASSSIASMDSPARAPAG